VNEVLYRLSHATMLSYFQPTSPVGHLEQFVLAMWSSLQQNYEAVFKPLKPLISKELAVFLLHGRVFSQGVFRGCSRFYEHGVFRVFRGCSRSGVFILFVALSSDFLLHQK